MELRGKVAIVTGASRGSVANSPSSLPAGARVVVAARTVEAHGRLPGTIGETLAAIEAVGGSAVGVPMDVTVLEDLERLIATTIDSFGRLDALVNNAATRVGATPPSRSTHVRAGCTSSTPTCTHRLPLSGWPCPTSSPRVAGSLST